MAPDPRGDASKAELIGPPTPPREKMPSIQVGLAIGPQATAAESFAAKLSPEDVGKIVDQGVVDSNNRHIENMAWISGLKQIILLGTLGTVVVALALVIVGKPEILREIIVFLAGAFSGYGANEIKKAAGRKK